MAKGDVEVTTGKQLTLAERRAANAMFEKGVPVLDVLWRVSMRLAKRSAVNTHATLAADFRLCTAPASGERTFEYDVLVLKASACGCAYRSAGSRSAVRTRIVGTDLAKLGNAPRHIRVAAADAILASSGFPRPYRTVRAAGSSEHQARLRARMVVEEVQRCLGGRRRLRGTIVGLVGFSRLIYQALARTGARVRAADLDHGLSRVQNRREQISLGPTSASAVVKEADVVIATGMTLANGTLDRILRTCNRRNIPVVMYAETGHAILGLLADLGLVAAVVSEPFPFYVFGAPTEFRIHRPFHGHKS